MKRGNFQISSRAPPRIPTGLHEPQAIERVKRGKFMDLENAHHSSCRADIYASSVPIEGPQDARCDDPKTSEYSYFRKLKKDSSQIVCRLLKEDERLKKFKPTECIRETKDIVNDGCKDLKSSLHTKDFTPINFRSFFSPHGGASKNSDHFKSSGNQWIDEEAFSRRRHKLRQWVDASFPEIHACSKGCDFIPVLLSRLSPKTSENKGSKGQKLQPVEIDMKSKSLAFPESYICPNKIQYSPAQHLRGLESGPYLNDGSSSYQIERSKKNLLWKWDLGSDPPICTPSKVHFQYQKEKLDCYLDDESFACLSIENDSTSGFSFEKYDLLLSNNLKQLDESHGQKEMMLGREPHSLDWDFDMRDDKISKIISSRMEFHMDSALPITLADSYWQSEDNTFDANELFPSPPLSYTSVSQSYSGIYHNHDCGLHSLERKCQVTELHHFPVTLRHSPNLAEDCYYDMCKDGSIVCSPQDHYWPMNMIFNVKQHPGLEALLFSSGFDFGLRQKQLLVTDYPGEHHLSAHQPLQFPQKEDICSEFVEKEFINWLNSNHKETLGHFPGDILHIQDWSSLSLLMPLSQEKAFPLLLDKSSWASEAETNIDDCEGKHG